MMIMANKCDLISQRVITKQRGQSLADQYGFEFIEVSAKNGENINYAFNNITQNILLKQYEQFQTKQNKHDNDDYQDTAKKGCCIIL